MGSVLARAVEPRQDRQVRRSIDIAEALLKFDKATWRDHRGLLRTISPRLLELHRCLRTP